MGMDGKNLLGRLVRLSKIASIKDVPQLTHALFPGTHCPLMGAAMAVGGIKNSMIVVVGTDECSYYTKSMTIGAPSFGGVKGRCVSVILDDHDVTFGSAKKVHAAFEEIVAEYKPECVFLVTTCVVEIIGDDYDAIAEELTRRHGIPVLAVHTEHFKCEDHFPGLERTVTACLSLMEARPCDDSVNVLGQRMGNFASTELYSMLVGAGVRIGMQLPCGCTVEEIKNAAAARVNIVVHELAPPPAQAMQEKFGIPYVYFDKFVIPENIYAGYKKLFACLGLPLPAAVEEKFAAARGMAAGMRKKLQGITYVYGNTPYYCFEFNSFLTQLGMIPQIIQTNRFSEDDAAYVQRIVEVTDPYVCKAANIAPLQYIYDVLHPYIYMGHEFPEKLRRKGIAILHSDAAGAMLGFEVTQYLLGSLAGAVEKAESYRKEAGL